MKKYALLSVTNKSGVISFARKLIDLGYVILSTGGTAKALSDEGVSYLSVAEFTSQKEIMDGRVKTLHPMIHGGILARRKEDLDLEELSSLGSGLIDVVAVNLYPFVEVLRNSLRSKTQAEMIEYIDIGGPTMLRAAAKNCEDVYSVIDPEDYNSVVENLQNGGEIAAVFRKNLAAKVFAHIASYDLCIAKYLSRDEEVMGEHVMSEYDGLVHQRLQPLRYGENPNQKAAWYAPISDRTNKISLRQLQGKELSYNNVNDIYAAAELALDLRKVFSENSSVVVIKHANPCGVAINADQLIAFRKAISCDPVSAFGGIIAFTSKLSQSVAEDIVGSFYEVILAPSFEEGAVRVLAEKKNLRVVEIDYEQLQESRCLNNQLKTVIEGSLVQSHDLGVPDFSSLEWVSGKGFQSEQQQTDALLAGVVCKHVKSNAIVLASQGLAIGIGAGQMNRVDSSRFAISRAESNNHVVKGSVVASDAFLPFSDNIDVFAKAGISLVVQPGGSIRDREVIDAAIAKGVDMVFTGQRFFRH